MPYDHLLDALEVSVVAFDRAGRILVANRRAREQFAGMGEAVNEDGVIVAPGDLIDEHGQAMRRAAAPYVRTLRTGEVIRGFLIGVPVASGDVLWASVSTSPVRDPSDGSIAGVLCSFVDVTEQHHAEDALRASEERFRLLAENAADVIYRINVGPAPGCDYVNPAVESVVGYTPEEIYATPSLLLDAVHEDDVARVTELFMVGTQRVETMQLRLRRPNGNLIWTEHRIVPIVDVHGTVVALEGIARDVTQLKLKEAFLSHRALHDPLTGLPNRVLLLDRLEGSLARLRRHRSFLAVLYLDLDRFKTVNDNLGHEVGDRLLHIVARRLQETLRPSDSVARLGGDEFAAILPDLHDESEAWVVAERLLAAVAEPIDLGEGELVTTISIGIAGAGDGSASAAELLRRADFAMYSAKDRGRARVESYDALTPSDRPPHTGGEAPAS